MSIITTELLQLNILIFSLGQMFVTGLSCKFLELDLALVFSPKQLCFLVGNDIS